MERHKVNGEDYPRLHIMGVDFDSPAFEKDYSEHRMVWMRGATGGLPDATILALAMKHQIGKKRAGRPPKKIATPQST
jgi:hypothetical protein